MKHLKSYKNIIEDEPKSDDLVFCKCPSYEGEIKEFIENTIGKVIYKNKSKYENSYRVGFIEELSPIKINETTKRFFKINPFGVLITTINAENVRKATPEEIKYYKIKLTANKYNL